jgi:hypothetical protein
MRRPTSLFTRRAVIASLAASAATASLRGWATEPAGAASTDPTQQRDFSIRDYGAKGDGKADDTAAFRAIHRHLLKTQRQLPQHRLIIHLPAGHYRYSWNQWLWGLRQVSVVGEGASLQCISDSPWDVAKFALTTNSDPLEGNSVTNEPGRPNFGYLIHAAEAGSRKVELVSPVNQNRFEVGRYVCIVSFDQQFGGYPPNCRYFEYAIVDALTGGSVTLDRPLRFTHSDRNFEDPVVPESIGRARIIPVDWPDQPLTLSQEIIGIKIVANPHAKEDFPNVFQAIGFRDLRIRDCSQINLVTSLGQHCEVVNTDMDFVEPDKLVSKVEFRNCHIGRISQATGIECVKLENCQLDRTSDIQARYVQAEGCEFRGAAHPEDFAGLSLDGFTPTRLLEVTNSVFVGKGGRDDVAASWNRPVAIKLTDPIMVLGNIIRIPSRDERARVFLSIIEPGDTVLLGSEFAGTIFSDGRSGTIEGIEVDGSDIVVETTAPARSDDTLFTFRVRQLRFQGKQYRDIQQTPPLSLATFWEDRVDNSKSYRWTFASNDFDQILPGCPGRIERITVEVLQPYRGTDRGAYLNLTTRTPAFGSINIATDLTKAGSRSASAREVRGIGTSDAWQPVGEDTVVWDFYMYHSLAPAGGHQRLAGSAAQQARYLLHIDTLPFWQTGSFHQEQYPL